MFLLVEGGRREDTERKQSAVTFRTRPHRTLSGLAFACRTQFFTRVPVALPSRLFCPSDLPLSAAMAASFESVRLWLSSLLRHSVEQAIVVSFAMK